MYLSERIHLHFVLLKIGWDLKLFEKKSETHANIFSLHCCVRWRKRLHLTVLFALSVSHANWHSSEQYNLIGSGAPQAHDVSNVQYWAGGEASSSGQNNRPIKLKSRLLFTRSRDGFIALTGKQAPKGASRCPYAARDRLILVQMNANWYQRLCEK